MRSIHKIIVQQFFANSGALTLTGIMILLTVGLDAVAPWPFKVLIDNVLTPQPIEQGTMLSSVLSYFRSRELVGFFVVFVYFVSTFSLAIVEYVRSIVTKNMIKRLTSDFSKRAFHNLQSLAIGFYKKQQIGDYIYRLSYDVSALGELLEQGIIPLVTSLLYLIVTVTIMWLIDVRLTLLSLVALPFLAGGLYSFNAYITHATNRSEFFNSAAFSFIEEALTHLKIIQAFSQQQRESHRFDEKINTSLRSDLTLYRLDFLLTLLVGIVIAVSYSFIILYGIRGVFSGTLTTGLLIVFIFYLDNLTNPILSFIDGVTMIRQSYIKINRMDDFFSPRRQLVSAGKIAKITDMTIVFDRVTLEEKGKKILHNLSFEIEAGKRTIIFGVNGSGKTSVINLILRFVDRPTRGRILLGGRDVQDYDLEILRNAIAFVPQEITLFNETIRNNIAFGNPRSSWKDIRRAAKLADADGFIQNLPGKYHFVVGEGGGFLSGGQRQRLMLARALLKKNANILLFDETLSALDVRTRERVVKNIYDFSQGKTTIIVSNIFSVVSAADNVIVLNRGRLIYSGHASRLPREIALYKMIVDANS